MFELLNYLFLCVLLKHFKGDLKMTFVTRIDYTGLFQYVNMRCYILFRKSHKKYASICNPVKNGIS